jgi:hypothetical protein
MLRDIILAQGGKEMGSGGMGGEIGRSCGRAVVRLCDAEGGG